MRLMAGPEPLRSLSRACVEDEMGLAEPSVSFRQMPLEALDVQELSPACPA